MPKIRRRWWIPDKCGERMEVSQEYRFKSHSTPAGRNPNPIRIAAVCAVIRTAFRSVRFRRNTIPALRSNQALDTGNVEILAQTVATEVVIDDTGASANRLLPVSGSGRSEHR